MQGMILIDKPEGLTSFDVVAAVRRAAGIRRVGHTGTLDPMATGVLPVLIGRATQLADLLPNSDKRYRAVMRLGTETDTLDITGRVLRECPVSQSLDDVMAAAVHFRGTIDQIPPMYSALQQGGVRLYELARQGIEVERPARQVTIYSLDITAAFPQRNEYELDIHCSKGTYIRSLCADIGNRLGCGAVMVSLRRTEACGFSEADCLSLDTLRERGAVAVLLPPDRALLAYPAVRVSPAQAVRFCNGGMLDFVRTGLPADTQGLLRIYGTRPSSSAGQEELLGLAQGDASIGALRPRCLLAEPPA